jgi:hypothetical protein
MSDRYVSERCEDIVDVVDGVAVVTQGFGYHNPGEVRCELRETGNGFIAVFPAHNCITQDYYICMGYDQARDLVLALSKFKKALGFEEKE